MRAIQITEFGGPEVLQLADVPEPTAPEPLILIEVDTAGVNFADTHQAENSYLAPQHLPLIPGAEVVGRDPHGQRVVALLAGGGGYAERAAAHPRVTFPLPDAVDDLTALALVLQGTTAWHLLRTSADLHPGESVVVHSAAGGVGSLAVQLARAWGAGRVIATASTPEKRATAQGLGADVAIDVSALDGDGVRAALVHANGGHPVDIVLEMTGGPVFDGSLAALAPFGRLVTYGMASRRGPKPIHPGVLLGTSRAVIGFWLIHQLSRPGGLGPALDELLSLASTGGLVALDGGHYRLEDARQAHEALRSRRTAGKLVLDVQTDPVQTDPGQAQAVHN